MKEDVWTSDKWKKWRRHVKFYIWASAISLFICIILIVLWAVGVLSPWFPISAGFIFIVNTTGFSAWYGADENGRTTNTGPP